jgi:hypothetical protein
MNEVDSCGRNMGTGSVLDLCSNFYPADEPEENWCSRLPFRTGSGIRESRWVSFAAGLNLGISFGAL